MVDWVGSGPGALAGGRIQRRGAGANTLCQRCNNNTGSWYGAEYVLWAQRGLELLDRIPPGTGPHKVTIVGRYPLRFLKQAVTMFFSTNIPGFAERNQELVRFILDRDRKFLPSKYDVYLTLFGGPYARASGVIASANIFTGRIKITSEVAHPPFALLLTIDSPPHEDTGRISHFGQFGYHEKGDVSVLLVTGEGHTPYPGDYRTKAQVERDVMRDRSESSGAEQTIPRL